MSRESDAERQLVQQVVGAIGQLPLAAKVGVAVLAIAAAITLYAWSPSSIREPTRPEEAESADVGTNIPPPTATFPAGCRDVVFCIWNLENLFDDHDDHLKPPDEEFDAWFARDPAARTKKYHNLATALLKLNAGRGPDIVAAMELESLRAAVMLQDALNAALPAGAEPYRHVAMKELANAGRHIAPGIVSRLPLERVRLLGHRQRILEVHVTANGHDLTVIAAHWTSHLSDDGHKKEGGRNGYATVISEAYQAALEADPKVDFLVCGDFNDEPDSDAVAHTLHLVGDSRQVTAGARPPKLFGLLSGRPADEFGTIFYKKPLIYDHIGVSPGLFDNRGWGYDPASVRVPTDGLIEPSAHGRRPWRFGGPKDLHSRGYSDHFPVLVTLRVAP